MQIVSTPADFSEKWKVENDQQKLFTGDQVIDAYLSGKRDGLQSAQKVILNQLQENVDKSGQKVNELLSHLDGLSFNGTDAFLKINSWNYLTVLVSVKEDDFFNESFLKVYEYVEKLESELNNEACHVNFSFVDYNNSLNHYTLKCDGFILKYQRNAS